MSPLLSQWGSSGWIFLHCVSFSYSTKPSIEERRNMLNFLLSVGHVLPCRRCRSHYNHRVQHLVISSAVLDNRETLSRFLVDLHNDVNTRLGRRTMDYETVRQMYSAESDSSWTNIAVCSVAALVVLVIMLCVLRRRRRVSVPAFYGQD